MFKSNLLKLLLFSFLCFMIVDPSNGQGEDVCPSLDAPENGAVSQSSPVTAFSLATFTCDEGYDLVGINQRLCRTNGAWTGSEATCIIVDCLAPPLITNGMVSVNATTFNSTASYSCNNGYELTGNSDRICLSTGTWSGEEPECTLVDCETLEDPTNGAVVLSTTTFMSTANYSCDNGYTLEGDSTRACLGNGSWSGAEPTCPPVDCGPPPAVENGGPDTVGSTTLESFVIYSCNEGYNLLAGANTVSVCQADGEWSAISVTCQIVTCPRLFTPFQITLTFTDMFNFGSEATYECNIGFEIVSGTGSRFCQSSGAWNGSLPTCDRVNCGPPSTVTNGSLTIGFTTFNSLARYSCDEGFVLDPPSQEIRTCTAEGVWSGPDPACNPADCGPPSEIPSNGAVEFNLTTHMSTANYSCEFGFELSPPTAAVRVCEASGRWSGADPVCDMLIQCPPLSTPLNGLVNISSVNSQLPRTTGSTASYQCDTGYDLLGNETRTCLISGNWSDIDPSCQDDDECNRENGGCAQICLNTPGSFQCACDVGYTLSTDSFSCDNINECLLSEDNCHENADCTDTEGSFVCSCQPGFQGDGQSCVADCGLLPPIENGTITYSPDTTVGGVATHSCDEGFLVQGGTERMCQLNGLWEPRIIFCLKVVHVEFEPMDYSVLETGSVLLLGVVKRNVTDRPITVFFSTRAGSAVVERDYMERENVRLTFSPNVTVTFVTIVVVDGAEFRDNVTVFGVLSNGGDVGVSVGPDALITIIEDEPPNEECVVLENPNNGRVIMNGTQIGDSVSYECDTGFTLVGEEMRTCNLVGLWTDQQPLCQIVDCGPLSDPANGTVTLSLTTYLSTANYSCDNLFRLEGTESRVCTAEGVWSPEEPVCQDVLAVCAECDPNARCIPVDPLHYDCQCLRGFTGDGRTCLDINECALGIDSCDENADCFNTEGGHSCNCRPGYQGGGVNCQNINECVVGSDDCHFRALCADTEGSFTCTCRPGFEGDGVTCTAPPCSNNFQLVLESIDTCRQFLAVGPRLPISGITDNVLSLVNTECGDDCMLLPPQIINTELSCSESDLLLYRATINVKNGENCTQIISLLSDWISTSPSIVVNSIRLQIASYCDIEFESFNIPSDCFDPSNNGTRSTDDTQTTSDPTSDSAEGVQLTMIEIIIIGSVCGGVGLLLLLTLLLICCVFIVRISRISKSEPARSPGGASADTDTLAFHETPSQRRRRNKATYDSNLAQAPLQFSTFAPSSNDYGAPPLDTAYSQMTTSLQGGDTIMHNQAVAEIEFHH